MYFANHDHTPQFFLLGRPRQHGAELTKAYKDAMRMLSEQAGDVVLELVEEERAEKFAEQINLEIEAHHG